MSTNSGTSGCVSVIIPVFQAARFIEDAVASALRQEHTLEVLLIEDGSTDGSFDVCRQLSEKHSEKVRLHTHRNRQNLGAGASRNVGIKKARGSYIAFLDADDVMLPERFSFGVQILDHDGAVDGVYEPVGVEEIEEHARPRPKSSRQDDNLIRVFDPPEPPELLASLVDGRRGVFHTNGVLFRSEVFARVGLFNPTLRLAQDSELWWRIAAVCRLVPGLRDTPVAVVRRHRDNRYSEDNPEIHESAFRVALSVWRWSRGRADLSPFQRRVLFSALERSIAAWPWADKGFLALRRIQLGRLLRALPSCPALVVSPWLWTNAIVVSTRWFRHRGGED